MEKPSQDFDDLDDWELLPDRMNFPTFSHGSNKDALLKEIMMDMDYFSPSHLVTKYTDEDRHREYKDIRVVSPENIRPEAAAAEERNRDGTRENEHMDIGVEFVDVMAQIKLEKAEEEEIDRKLEEEEREKDEDRTGCDIEGKACWNWRLRGIGGFFSMGAAAAATACILIFGGRQQQKQRIQFKIYADEKRMKAVVQQATRLNQALSAVRGTPMTRAHISFGGYYTGI
ncbi:hypothetical protein Cni_G16815 [Canna indica]|uniref:DUF6821 domain-containing protein n=1 Tax=Canna indica TaxID=4628 RepID=A0AAQ3KJ89_9LILI|nr:hypothetical protein Cni_G16815 [Canna indica]